MRWNPTTAWIYSQQLAHEALVDDHTFQQVQTRILVGANRPDVVSKPRVSKRQYALSGLLHCGLCGRRMIGSFKQRAQPLPVHLRRRIRRGEATGPPAQPVHSRRQDHRAGRPVAVPRLRPHNIEATLQQITNSQVADADLHRIEVAREKIAACDTKLRRYRAALEAGTDPTLVQ
jgi:site-specific DNA recombinase